MAISFTTNQLVSGASAPIPDWRAGGPYNGPEVFAGFETMRLNAGTCGLEWQQGVALLPASGYMDNMFATKSGLIYALTSPTYSYTPMVYDIYSDTTWYASGDNWPARSSVIQQTWWLELPEGKIIACPYGNFSSGSDSMIGYDPDSGKITTLTTITTFSSGANAGPVTGTLLLDDGTVFLARSYSGAYHQIYTPSTNSVTTIGSALGTTYGSANRFPLMLPDGRIFLPLASQDTGGVARIFDFATSTESSVGSGVYPTTGTYRDHLQLLDGRVLTMDFENEPQNPLYIFDWATDTVDTVPVPTVDPRDVAGGPQSLTTTEYMHALLLPDGQVMFGWASTGDAVGFYYVFFNPYTETFTFSENQYYAGSGSFQYAFQGAVLGADGAYYCRGFDWSVSTTQRWNRFTTQAPVPEAYVTHPCNQSRAMWV
jgi:hypothetical protein